MMQRFRVSMPDDSPQHSPEELVFYIASDALEWLHPQPDNKQQFLEQTCLTLAKLFITRAGKPSKFSAQTAYHSLTDTELDAFPSPYRLRAKRIAEQTPNFPANHCLCITRIVKINHTYQALVIHSSQLFREVYQLDLTRRPNTTLKFSPFGTPPESTTNICEYEAQIVKAVLFSKLTEWVKAQKSINLLPPTT